jgi:hypothetical protein
LNFLVSYFLGEYIEFDEDMFADQMVIPEVDSTYGSSQEGAPVKNYVNKSIPDLKNMLSDLLDKTPYGKSKSVLDSEVDTRRNYESPVPTTRSGKSYSPPVKKRKDPAMNSGDITTSKRPTRKPAKWSGPVELLKPGQFAHLKNARLLKDFMLSKHAVDNYGS